MRDHIRVVAICCTVLLTAIIGAIQFRYKTYNKEGWNTAVYDRWTGTLKLCSEQGCYTDEELKSAASRKAPPEAQPPSISIVTPLGANLEFAPGTTKDVIEKTVAKLDACGARAKDSDAFARCYRPSVADQADGPSYTVTSAILPIGQM